jgi:oligopeptide transport system substrate-binding protein
MRIVAASIGLLLLLAALATVVTPAADRADFTFVNRGDVNTLDLQQMSWTQDLRLAHALYEGLARLDVSSPDYTPVPAAATWAVSPDALTYIFTLRDHAKWSNGSPLRASDFLYSWRRGLLPDIQCDYIGQLQLIKGARAFSDWRASVLDQHREHQRTLSSQDAQARADDLWLQTQQKFDDLVHAKAPDDRTLIVTLERPTAYFLDLCAFPTFFPVYPPLVDAHQSTNPETGQIQTQTGWTKPGRLISNGPFILTAWRFKRDMRFEANPHYWNASAINIRSMAIPSIEDGNAAVLAFKTGAVDWVSDVTPEYRADVIAQKRAFYHEHAELVASLHAQGLDPFEIDRRLPLDPRANIHILPSFGTYWYNVNCLPTLRDGRTNPLADPRLRRALALAIDKQALVEQVTRCGELPATTIIPPASIAGYRSPDGLPFDPAAARALLAEAGFPAARGLPTLELLFNKDGIHDKLAQAIANDWQLHLGLSIRLEVKETKVFRQDLRSANYMISRGSWFGDYGDPTTFLDLHRKDDGNNDRKYHNPHFEDLMDRAAAEPDAANRLALLAQAERIIVEEDLPVIPLFHYTNIFQFDAHRVHGLNPFPRNTQLLGQIEIRQTHPETHNQTQTEAKPQPQTVEPR